MTTEWRDRAQGGAADNALPWPACPTCGTQLQRGELDTGIPGTAGLFPILECPNGHPVDAGPTLR